MAFALQLRKKHGRTSARVVSRATQADSVKKKNKYNTRTEYNTITCTIQEYVQYKNMNSTIHRRKTVIQSSTM
jgi:hypothetical protein